MDRRTPRSAEAARTFAARAVGRWVLATALCVATGVLACRARPVIRVTPVGNAASEAMSEAQASLRGSGPADRAQARDLARRALDLEPGWVAPERLLDDLQRDDLCGIEALQEHRARLARMGEQASRQHVAGELYLAGRLEGLDGEERFEAAVRIDPDLSWGYHGRAWIAGVQGDTREAVVQARAALARARESWERSFFTSALARALVAADQREQAAELLEARIAAADTRPADKDSLERQVVEIGLDATALRTRSKSYQRGLALLREKNLAEGDIEGLVARLRLAPSPDDPDGFSLQSSLAVQRSPARDRLRAELMLESSPTPLALALLQHGLEGEKRSLPAGALMRAARFAAGEYALAIELWLAELPACVLTPDGWPADPRVRRVVACARNLNGAAGSSSAVRAANETTSAAAGASDALAELGEALLAAGWFREARSVSEELAARDLDRALSIESRAVAGQEWIDGVRRLMRKVDLEQGGTAPPSSADVDTHRVVNDREHGQRFELAGEPTGVDDLASLLSALAPPFAEAHVFLGGDADRERMTRELLESPRMSYGPIGELVHPGPWFSKSDAEADLGRAGAPVPGLASELEKIGRFGLFGEVAGGGGPDGTVLPRIFIEERRGSHLGVPWSGTVAWCEGAEIKSRAGRHGARISAAALHEGYWVDIDAVRGEEAQWDALRRDFSGPTAHERIAGVLAVRGLELEAGDAERRSRERTQSGFLLGEAQRVRLALLVERGARSTPRGAAGEPALGEVHLDELVTVTATHEEGHLCDRTRYLPLGKHVGPVFLFLMDCGFSPKRVTEMLEYRAQLTSLCDSPDPRIPLAQVLDAVEQGPTGITPHARGYTLLLSDYLDVLDDELARHPGEFPTIDANYTLAHQLHDLGAEDVRRVALRLAHKKRLTK